MTQKELFRIYAAVAEHKKLVSPNELAEKTGMMPYMVSGGARYLERAELLREHIREEKLLYEASGVEFVIFDAREKIFVIRAFDEALSERQMGVYYPMADLELYENLQQFTVPLMSKGYKRFASFCLLPPENMDVFCEKALPPALPVIEATPEKAAEAMRRKYFKVKLELRKLEIERRKARGFE